METPSQLEQFLRSCAEGEVESQGKFTLDRDEALSKLAAFQLPFETAWVLKIVQAAVSCGAERLHIKQTSTDTVFEFCFPEAWTCERLEQAFFEPQGSGDRALDHLMKGLWGASLNDGRPFQLIPPAQIETVLWTGQQLLRVPPSHEVRAGVVVSHRKLSEGTGFFGIRNIQAARRNSEVLKALVERAFVCPLKLTVDGLRLDVLQLCPHYGVSPASHPLLMGWSQKGEARFRLPPGSFAHLALEKNRDVDPVVRRLSDEVARATEAPDEVYSAWLVSAHFGRVKQGKKYVWKASAVQSSCFWVEDGVIIDNEKLDEERAVSVALFAPAHDLQKDVSGFGLVRNAAYEARKKSACETVYPHLVELDMISLQELIEESARLQKQAGTLMLALGALIVVASPVHTLFMVAAGLWTRGAAGQAERSVEDAVNLAIHDLKVYWKWNPTESD